jgi:hypothetical protein
MLNRVALVVSALSVAVLMLAAPREARAQGSEGTGIGVGVQAMNNPFVVIDDEPPFFIFGLAGPSVVYQTPSFHVDGILSFASNGATAIGAGGRFFYELHSTQASDLSVGGGIGFLNIDTGPDSDTHIQFEIGGKIRAFLAPSVAVNASVGFGFISTAADDPLFLTGQLLGSIGITYFFF